MSESIQLIFYGAPVAKGRPRFGRNGHAFTPVKTREYEKSIRAQATEIVTMHGWEPTENDYDVSCIVFRQARRGDVDNLAKSPLDAMNGIVWPDDRWIRSLYIERNDTEKDNPRVEVTVRKL